MGCTIIGKPKLIIFKRLTLESLFKESFTRSTVAHSLNPFIQSICHKSPCELAVTIETILYLNAHIKM